MRQPRCFQDIRASLRRRTTRAGMPDHRRVRRNIVEHDGIRADARMVADRDRADDFCSRADEHVAADSRALPALGADRHLMLDEHVRRRRRPCR